jgi:Rieske Fe-S protein
MDKDSANDTVPSAPDGDCTGCSRRNFFRIALATGLNVSLGETLADDAASNAPPQPGDRFVFSDGERAGQEIAPADIPLGGPQVVAWPIEPASKIVRSGSRLSQVVLVKLDPASLDDETRSRSAEGVVAYSAVCKHAQCPVTGWIPEKQLLHCYCHDSQYDPRHGAKVVFGPAPRSLPALPVKIVDGVLMAAGKFLGKVGQSQS